MFVCTNTIRLPLWRDDLGGREVRRRGGEVRSGEAEEEHQGERRQGQKDRPRGAAAGQRRFAGAVVVRDAEAGETPRP